MLTCLLYLTLVLTSSLTVAETAPNEIVLVVPAERISSNDSISFGYDIRGHPLYENKKFIGVKPFLNFTIFYPNNSLAMDTTIFPGADCTFGTVGIGGAPSDRIAPIPGM
jgi:hypothetical protein